MLLKMDREIRTHLAEDLAKTTSDREGNEWFTVRSLQSQQYFIHILSNEILCCCKKIFFLGKDSRESKSIEINHKIFSYLDTFPKPYHFH